MSFLNKKSGVVRRVAAVAILGIGIPRVAAMMLLTSRLRRKQRLKRLLRSPQLKSQQGIPSS